MGSEMCIRDRFLPPEFEADVVLAEGAVQVAVRACDVAVPDCERPRRRERYGRGVDDGRGEGPDLFRGRGGRGGCCLG